MLDQECYETLRISDSRKLYFETSFVFICQINFSYLKFKIKILGLEQGWNSKFNETFKVSDPENLCFD